MLQPGRKYDAGNVYRYGFNGKEQDLETTSTTTYDYGFRIYSPGLGRFLSVDPLQKNYPYYTPYQFSGNTPIQAVDLDGREPKRPKMLTNDLGWFKPVIGHWNYIALLPSERSSSGYELQNMGSSKAVVWEYEYIAWTGTQTYPHTQDMVWVMFNGTFYNATGLNSVSPSDLEGKETWEQYWGKQQMLQNSLNDISERAATAVAIVQLASGFKNIYAGLKGIRLRSAAKSILESADEVTVRSQGLRSGYQKAVEIIKGDRKIDISADRVKEWVKRVIPSGKNKGKEVWQEVKYSKDQALKEGDKTLWNKRAPTETELEVLNQAKPK